MHENHGAYCLFEVSQAIALHGEIYICLKPVNCMLPYLSNFSVMHIFSFFITALNFRM